MNEIDIQAIQQSQKNKINFEKYISLLIRNWYVILGSLVAGLTISYFVNKYSTPTYMTQAYVMINDKTENDNVFQTYSPMLHQRSIIQNEKSVLKSYNLTRRTLEELDMQVKYFGIGRMRTTRLYPESNIEVIFLDSTKRSSGVFFLDVLNPNEYNIFDEDREYLDTILKFGQPFKWAGHHFKVVMQSYFEEQLNYKFEIPNINHEANRYKGKLNISLENDYGTVLVLSIKGSNRRLIVDYVNSLSEQYIDYSLEKKKQSYMRTLEFIQDQKDRIADSLNRLEQRLILLKLDENEIMIDEKGALEIETLAKIHEQKENVESKIDAYKQFLEFIKGMRAYDEVIVLSNADEKDQSLLRTELNELKNLIDQQTALQVIEGKNVAGLKWFEDKIKAKERIIHQNLKTQLKFNKWVSAKMDSVLNAFEFRLKRLSSEKIKVLNYERRYEVFRTFYNILLEKEAQISIEQSSITTDKRILDYARLDNTPLLAPKSDSIYRKGIMFSLGLSIGLLLLIQVINPNITNREDITNNTSVPMLGLIGHNDSGYEIPVVEKPNSIMSESFRRLRTNLQFVLREENDKIVMITSTVSGEGKTFASINMASIMALTDKKVLLLGMDLRKPNLNKVFNLPNDIGLSTYLAGRSEFEEIVHKVNVKNLSVAVSGPMPPNPAELVETERFKELLARAKQEFDYIFIDTSPIALVTDALLIARHANATVFILRQNYTRRSSLDMINEFYEEKKISNLNLLINDVKISKTMGYQYSYGYNYTYGYGYGKYYND